MFRNVSLGRDGCENTGPEGLPFFACASAQIFLLVCATRENSIRKIKKHIHACKLKKQTRNFSLRHLGPGPFDERLCARGERLENQGKTHHANGEKLWRAIFDCFRVIKNGDRATGWITRHQAAPQIASLTESARSTATNPSYRLTETAAGPQWVWTVFPHGFRRWLQ